MQAKTNNFEFIENKQEDKTMKKLFQYLMIVCIAFLVSPAFTIKAEEPSVTPYVFEFSDFTYINPEITEENSTIQHKKTSTYEKYIVYDPKGHITDELIINYPADETNLCAVNPDSRDSIFTRYKYVYGNNMLVVKLRFDISVKLYSSGSFRDFEAVNYSAVNIDSAATRMAISGSPHTSVTSHTGRFPCTQLDYSYTATVYTSGEVSIEASYLIGAGFTQTTYYYKTISDTGIIRLYN